MKDSELVINALRTIFDMEIENKVISKNDVIYVEFENNTIAKITATDLN